MCRVRKKKRRGKASREFPLLMASSLLLFNSPWVFYSLLLHLTAAHNIFTMFWSVECNSIAVILRQGGKNTHTHCNYLYKPLIKSLHESPRVHKEFRLRNGIAGSTLAFLIPQSLLQTVIAGGAALWLPFVARRLDTGCCVMESGAGRSQKCAQRGQFHILPRRFLSNIVLLIVSLFLHVSLPDVSHQRWMNNDFFVVSWPKNVTLRENIKSVFSTEAKHCGGNVSHITRNLPRGFRPI